ncbi:MAG TPA: endonuclease/exonuclease/phosphatase family protein [Pyrinomonadaceae bacterium]|nr:endonuclease/exonuclease/phosphatase family protein [Pyrinomonadaceae bacterium]
MRITIAFLLLLLVFPALQRDVLAQIPDFCNGRSCVQAGSFNIEWFGATDTSHHKHRSKLAVSRIADLIADTLDLELVVLEEINSESEEYEWLSEFLKNRGYELRSGTAGGEQRVVIAFDTDEVSLLNDNNGEGVKEMNVRSSLDLGGGCQSSNLRLPLYGKFKAGEFDFVLVGVHLKSQRKVDGADDPVQCADDIRHAQAEDIVAALPGVMSALNDEDVLIAGDFNATLSDPSLSPLFSSGGFVSLTQASRRGQGSNSISYLKEPFQEIIDHVLIRLANTTEWANTSTFIFNPPSNQTLLGKYLKYTSDHAPVWTSFFTDGN